MSKTDTIKRIVIFADGTGNAFSTQESNVWRLYQALDLSAADQVAHYLKGVGTSGFKLYASFDAATGIGVPANVRKLYRFLCWNWRPGVEIYLFGFSRGAFTVRTLIGLLGHEGLVPTEMDGVPVSQAQMARNAMAAWRSYRAKTIPGNKVMLTIRLTRLLRDAVLGLRNLFPGYTPYKTIQAQNRRDIPILFAGLFDTVEAYGVPFAELRRAIDRAIWPISFRNRELSPLVATARHALALDEERVTFHPVRFDMTYESLQTPRIKEVWFAGVHSDIGGGYPDDALAYVPLRWMLKETLAAPGGALRFKPGTESLFREAGSPLAPIHDSRSGFAGLYRYGPRILERNRASGGPPVVHYSVPVKMVYGTENYAPLTLPAQACVVLPDGAMNTIVGFPAASFLPAATSLEQQQAETAVRMLHRPNPLLVGWTRDLIWWRRVAYFALLATLFLLILLPVTAPWLARHEFWLSKANAGLSSTVNDLSTTAIGIIPSYAMAWVKALVAAPLASLAIIGLAALAYGINLHLRGRIADMARCAWFFGPWSPAYQKPGPKQPFASGFAHHMRKATWSLALGNATARFVLPLALRVLLPLAVLVGAHRFVTGYQDGAGSYCHASTDPRQVSGPSLASSAFNTSNPCWASGLAVQKGRRYRLWMKMLTPYQDAGTAVGITGFEPDDSRGYDGHHHAGIVLRRWWTAGWFAPIARIGATGNAEWPLQPRDGITQHDLAVVLDAAPKAALCDPSPPAPDTASVAALRQALVTDFTAQATGELFLFVNDAVTAEPDRCFYNNNQGTASVTITPLPTPDPPPG